MKPKRLAVYIIVAIVAFSTGIWYSHRSAGTANKSSERQTALRYSCPMHPHYISDRPGDCPSCGMRLIPVDQDRNGAEARKEGGETGISAGTIHVSPDRLQVIGVRLGRVERAPFEQRLRILGRVAVDETLIYRLNASVNGWIRKTFPNSKGSLIKKDEILVTFYSPEFLSAEQALLYSLNALDRWQASGKETSEQIALTKANIQQAVDSLRNLGMGDIQIDEIKRSRQLTQDIEVRAPAAGFILERNVSPGQRFEQGIEFYRIADLSHIWILADMFENDVQYFKPGANATVIHAAQKLKLPAKVSNVLPQFDPLTRTLKVRLEAANPGFILKPDMFVDVEYPISIPAALSVPSEAILDTGLQKKVFVEMGDGYFEPRRVETGWRMGGQVEITKGLMEGERIVVSGNFLIDSESRMKLAAAALPVDYVVDPVCGMDVDPVKAGNKKSEYNGQYYYFCSDLCKAKFDKDPTKYGGQAARARNGIAGKAQEKTAKDLVCGMDVDVSSPEVTKAVHKNKTYYFCSALCRHSFESAPEKYLAQQAIIKTTAH
jgi:membrane fusion protein, copper/silver efflux system